MISLIAALVISPQADLLESFSYEWQDQLEKYQLNCTVVQGEKTGEIEVELANAEQSLWKKTTTILEPLSKPSESVIIRAGSGSRDRIVIITIERNNWNYSYIVHCTPQGGFDTSFSYRGPRANFMKFERDSFGMAKTMTTYDKFVGGKAASVKQNGVTLSRWEQVRTQRITPKGFQFVSSRFRLVPPNGGGIAEKNFAWRAVWEK